MSNETSNLAHNIPPRIVAAQLTEIRRRITQIKSGEVALIPGGETLVHVRRIVASARAVSQDALHVNRC